MRAVLSVLLTVWLTLPVSDPAFAEKRARLEAKQSVARRTHEPALPPTAARPSLPAGEREKGCTGTAAIVSGRACD